MTGGFGAARAGGLPPRGRAAGAGCRAEDGASRAGVVVVVGAGGAE